MKTTVGYSVVLPTDYASTDRRYPVIYWLHGGGGNECSSLFTAEAWRELSAADEIQDVILVYPAAFRSGYMDHHDGKVMVETMIIRELIPRIDDRFRTIATRNGRAVHGFSMGSSGALKFTIKYPQLFCSAAAWGGGSIDLANSQSDFILKILERNLKSDPELIRRNNTYHYLPQNAAILRELGTRILLICGNEDPWKESAVKFQAELQAVNIPCDLKLVPNAAHNLRKTFNAEGRASALFQDEVFGQTLSE